MFKRYGRWWFETRQEAIGASKYGDRIYYDAGMKIYYVIKKKKGFFDW